MKTYRMFYLGPDGYFYRDLEIGYINFVEGPKRNFNTVAMAKIYDDAPIEIIWQFSGIKSHIMEEVQSEMNTKDILNEKYIYVDLKSGSMSNSSDEVEIKVPLNSDSTVNFNFKVLIPEFESAYDIEVYENEERIQKDYFWDNYENFEFTAEVDGIDVSEKIVFV